MQVQVPHSYKHSRGMEQSKSKKKPLRGPDRQKLTLGGRKRLEKATKKKLTRHSSALKSGNPSLFDLLMLTLSKIGSFL